MRASKLDRQITIERKSVTLDPVYGSEVVTWVPLVALPGSPVVGQRFYASVIDAPPARAESVDKGLVVARNQTRVQLRYRNNIDSTMRIIVHGDPDRTLQIVGGPAMIGRKQGIELLCEEFSSE